MMRKARTANLRVLLGGIGFMVACFGCASTQTTATGQPTAQPVQAAEKQVIVQPAALPIQAPYFPAPSTIDLCGEPVPLHIQEVYERFDREFTLIVYNHAQVYLWLKRMERWFPMIEERLRKFNLPDDLKWVAIVESDLVPNVVSSKGAAGPWQFMPMTGSAYGLEQKGSVDKRYDFERSTDSAFIYLQDLHRKYKNWAIAIAAYNCGEKRILEESRTQTVPDYYHMKLPQETERYVMRILAIKAVLGSPNKYGYDLPKGWGYQELKVDKTTISCPSPISIQSLANAIGITYREFKRLNPIFRAESIPPGNHEVKVPTGYGKVLESNLQSKAQPAEAPSPAIQEPKARVKEPVASSPKPKPIKAQVHTVSKGDTLSSIARYFNITVQALKEANKLKSDDLSLGQKLRIP
ncbi:MAG: transglycosylase SLT domain-containing protein [Syntrophobacteraceae bacterium]